MQHTTRIMDGGSREEWRDPSSKIVDEVARAKGVDALSLDPLFEEIEVDALDDLLKKSKPGVEVTFEYEGYGVRIRGDGQIFLEE